MQKRATDANHGSHKFISGSTDPRSVLFLLYPIRIQIAEKSHYQKAEATEQSLSLTSPDSKALNRLRGAQLRKFGKQDYHLRNYKALIEIGRAFVAQNSNSWIAHYRLAEGYEGSGQMLLAIPEYQKAVELSQGDQDPTAALAHAYAATGRRAEAQKILRQFSVRSETNYVSPYVIATVYASLGDKDKVFEYLETAYLERSSDLPCFLKFDLRVDSLRSDPRFQDLMRRMHFPN